MFPWAAALEAKTDVIREELKAALEKEGKDFTPYIALRPGAAGRPVEGAQPFHALVALFTLARWRSRRGAPGAVPGDREGAWRVDMATIAGLCPNAMFSALAPHTEIPPHNGETNARLVVHLPLIVPPKCTYRVGFEHREWRVGEILVFDDTIEHTARNDRDELRVVLIFESGTR